MARLGLATDRTDVVSGESIEIRATIGNDGSSVLSIPTESLSPVEYMLRAAASGRQHVLSQVDDTETLRAGRPAPDLPREDVRVPPGQVATYRDDIALYAQERLPPGRYRVTATCVTGDGRIEAALPDIEVVPARIGGFSTLHCFYSHVQATGFSHTGRDNATWIFQEDTRTQELRTGVFFRRHQLPPGGNVTDLVVAVHTQPRLEGRWLAWIRDGSFAALSGWGDALTGLVDPVGIDLDSPQLVAPGFQNGDDTCLFLCAGGRAGATWLVPCQVAGMRAVVGPAVKLCDGRPRRILARGHEAGRQMGAIDVGWADQDSNGATDLHAAACGPDGRLAEPPRQLYRSTAPLLAWELEPYAAAAPGAVHALFGPEGDDRRITYVRAPLDGRTPALETRLPPLPIGLTHPLQAWAISGLEPSQMRVAALAATGEIWMAARGEWMKLLDAPGARDLRLVTTPFEAYWGAVWIDPDAGARYLADPEFIR